MAFLLFHNVLLTKSFLPKPTFLGSWDFRKTVQKGPEVPKPIFSEGGWYIMKTLEKSENVGKKSENVGKKSENDGKILKVLGKS